MKKQQQEYIVERLQDILHGQPKKLTKKQIEQLASLIEKVKNMDTKKGGLKEILTLIWEYFKE